MKRSLFVTSNRLGDAVLTTGVLKYLVDREPHIPITVVCGHIPKDIFENFEGVERVIPLKKKKYSKHWLDALYQTGPRYWHRIVDFRSSLFGILPARHRHIWRGGNDTIHKAVVNAAMIGLDFPLGPSITPTAAQLDITASKLCLSSDSRPIIAFAPTANFPDKQWHNENYLSLAKALTAEGAAYAGARVAIFGAPGEEAQAVPVVEGLPENQVIDLVGKTTPSEAAAFLSKAQLFVGNDSGLMHTAVAVNTPTVGLFGIGKPAVYGPWGENTLCLKSTPAGTPICEAPSQSGGDALPVSYVLSQIETFLKNRKQPT